MFEKIKKIILNYAEVDADSINENTSFVEDLGFSSFDFMSFLGEVEDELDVEVDEREVINIHTVGEAIEYIKSI